MNYIKNADVDIEVMSKRINEIRKHIDDGNSKKELLNQNLAVKEEEKDKKISENQHFLTMKKLIEESCSTAREQGRLILSEVATLAVQSVFGDDVTIDVKIDTKDGIPYAEVVCYNRYDKGIIEIDPAQNDGGGLADIISMALLIAIEQINGSNNFAPFILDEPSKFVSKGDLSEKFANFTGQIVETTEKQFIIATHDENLIDKGNVVYRMILDKDTLISNANKCTTTN